MARRGLFVCHHQQTHVTVSLLHPRTSASRPQQLCPLRGPSVKHSSLYRKIAVASTFTAWASYTTSSGSKDRAHRLPTVHLVEPTPFLPLTTISDDCPGIHRVACGPPRVMNSFPRGSSPPSTDSTSPHGVYPCQRVNPYATPRRPRHHCTCYPLDMDTSNADSVLVYALQLLSVFNFTLGGPWPALSQLEKTNTTFRDFPMAYV